MNDSTTLDEQEDWPLPPPTPPRAPGQTLASDREVLATCIVDVARDFADRALPGRSISRTQNLYHRYGLSLDQFLAVMTAAQAITQERSPSGDDGPDASARPARLPAFFAVLEELLAQTLPATGTSQP